MLNEIMDGVTRRLNELFGDGCAIYTDPVEQSLQEPCFFVRFLEPSEKQVMGQRYFRRIDLCIQYLPGNPPEVLRELNRMADLLMDGMEHLTLADGSLIKGTERSSRPDLGEKQLTFFVSYHTYVIKQKKKEENMSDIRINHPKTEKGKVE